MLVSEIGGFEGFEGGIRGYMAEWLDLSLSWEYKRDLSSRSNGFV